MKTKNTPMAGSLVMLSNNQCERSRALSGLAELSKDHVMKAEASTHQMGKNTMAERTFIEPMAEESISRRFMALLNHPLAL